MRPLMAPSVGQTLTRIPNPNPSFHTNQISGSVGHKAMGESKRLPIYDALLTNRVQYSCDGPKVHPSLKMMNLDGVT